jgi:hypothetical protein
VEVREKQEMLGVDEPEVAVLDEKIIAKQQGNEAAKHAEKQRKEDRANQSKREETTRLELPRPRLVEMLYLRGLLLL